MFYAASEDRNHDHRIRQLRAPGKGMHRSRGILSLGRLACEGQFAIDVAGTNYTGHIAQLLRRGGLKFHWRELRGLETHRCHTQAARQRGSKISEIQTIHLNARVMQYRPPSGNTSTHDLQHVGHFFARDMPKNSTFL